MICKIHNNYIISAHVPLQRADVPIRSPAFSHSHSSEDESCEIAADEQFAASPFRYGFCWAPGQAGRQWNGVNQLFLYRFIMFHHKNPNKWTEVKRGAGSRGSVICPWSTSRKTYKSSGWSCTRVKLDEGRVGVGRVFWALMILMPVIGHCEESWRIQVQLCNDCNYLL